MRKMRINGLITLKKIRKNEKKIEIIYDDIIAYL